MSPLPRDTIPHISVLGKGPTCFATNLFACRELWRFRGRVPSPLELCISPLGRVMLRHKFNLLGGSLVLLTILLALSSSVFGQETTGGIQGTVKDSTGAVIPNATVEVTSPSLIGVKTAETDNGGYFHFAN